MNARRFVRRAARPKQNVQWQNVSEQWVFTGATGTAQSILISLQAPAAMNAITSDPPEDLTVLRVVGDFAVGLTGNAGGWSLALTVQDQTWTQGTTTRDDADKRLLWVSQYRREAIVAANNLSWASPNQLRETVAATGALVGMSSCDRGAVHIDISPRVRIEPGKALYLIAYEDDGSAILTVISTLMRVLFKRSGRR